MDNPRITGDYATSLAAKRYEQNDDFFVRMFSDQDMMQQVMDTVGSVLYDRLKKKKGQVRYEIQEQPVMMVAEDAAPYGQKGD